MVTSPQLNQIVQIYRENIKILKFIIHRMTVIYFRKTMMTFRGGGNLEVYNHNLCYVSVVLKPERVII